MSLCILERVNVNEYKTAAIYLTFFHFTFNIFFCCVFCIISNNNNKNLLMYNKQKCVALVKCLCLKDWARIRWLVATICFLPDLRN